MTTPFKSQTRLTSQYGKRKPPVPGASTFHKGVDFVISDKVVCAAADGMIRSVNLDADKDSAGRYVTIRHADGMITKYFHLEHTNWKVGQQVKEGEQIGVMGNTGIGSGPHLHFEVWLSETVVVEPTQHIGIENKVGPVVFKKVMPEWERLIKSKKVDSADKWVEVIGSRIALGQATDTIEQYFGELIKKLTTK